MSSDPTTTTSTDRYVNLGALAPKSWSMWSNDPADMRLDTYFSSDQESPGLEASYNLTGLKPVLVKPDNSGGGDKFLLTDATGAFFLFDEAANEMYRLTQSLELKEVVYQVQTETYDWAQVTVQYQITPR
ncbi:hypothetical protein QBC47DRAFT_202404 [Echria macrotheca]|uniref:Uncharacterized protein n=1 Tax=Echria macrotheca TaxID=438768 RepID=A0AAJ0BD25_9PEZI|nr:hypothetical protein QBC47DRAFT_202404 [Echria macrotheca]